MTDPRDELSPEQEREVAAFLASVAEPLTTPPEVVARLDDVLGELVAARADSGEPVPATVVPLRHRRWPAALLAAAALVVGGFAVGNVAELSLGGGGSDESGADTASLDAGAAEGGDDGGTAMPELDGSGVPLTRSGLDEVAAAVFVPRPDVRLRPARLDADLTALLARPAPTALGADPEAADDLATVRELTRGCVAPPLGDGDTWSAVTYGTESASRPVTLTLSAPESGLVTATVRACASGEVLARTRIPAPD